MNDKCNAVRIGEFANGLTEPVTAPHTEIIRRFTVWKGLRSAAVDPALILRIAVQFGIILPFKIAEIAFAEIIADMDFCKVLEPIYLYETDEYNKVITEKKIDSSSYSSLKYSLWKSNKNDGMILVIPYKRIQLFEHNSPFCFLLVRE